MKVVGIVLWGLLATTAGAAPPQGIIEVEPRPVPELRLSDLDGEGTDIADLRGRWVLVHFWASWCRPCRREMPTIAAMQQRLGDRLSVVLVNTAEPEEEVFAFLAAVAPELNTLLDSDGLVTERWSPRGLPSTFVVDPTGRIRYVALGGRVWDSPEFLSFLQDLVGRDAAAGQ